MHTKTLRKSCVLFVLPGDFRPKAHHAYKQQSLCLDFTRNADECLPGNSRKRLIYAAKDASGAKYSIGNLQKTVRISENCKMFVRYIVKYFNKQAGREETGVFRAADYVRDHTGIAEEEKEGLQKMITWFDENLPVPDFYDDPAQRSEDRHTYFWFRTSAAVFLEKMEALAAVLERNGVRVERLHAENIPGKLVFEDYCQIAVVPLEDILKIK